MKNICTEKQINFIYSLSKRKTGITQELSDLISDTYEVIDDKKYGDGYLVNSREFITFDEASTIIEELLNLDDKTNEEIQKETKIKENNKDMMPELKNAFKLLLTKDRDKRIKMINLITNNGNIEIRKASNKYGTGTINGESKRDLSPSDFKNIMILGIEVK